MRYVPFRSVLDVFASAFVVIVGCTACAPVAESAENRLDERAAQAAHAFLDNYVDDNGRVIRHDQGGDTVSEGQAYALLIASAVQAQPVFDKVWEWTEQNLMQPNGLPAWRFDEHGRVPDRQSASDADLLIAWALLRDTGPNRVEHNAIGLRMAKDVLEQELISTPAGDVVLAAGPWAVGSGSVNVSYWSSAVYTDLARLTGDPKWTTMADQVPEMLDELTDDGDLLPSDWAVWEGGVGEGAVGEDKALRPSSSPAGVGSSPSAKPQYGLDAQRAVVWSAVSCNPDERIDTSRWYEVLKNPDRARSAGLTLDGEIADPSTHPMPLIAAAAAADSADAAQASESFMESAERLHRTDPTFFGGAWIALGRILLDTNALNTCHG